MAEQNIKKGPIKAWKCFTMELKCRGIQFKVGETYEHDGPIKLCSSGFHFHEKFEDRNKYYTDNRKRICEVEAEEIVTDSDKSVCRKLTIVRELAWRELDLNCYGDGSGSGDGDGFGYGSGSGDGYGFGYGDGGGGGDGDGFDSGFGYGSGDGDGDGDGDGGGDGFGYGSGCPEISSEID